MRSSSLRSFGLLAGCLVLLTWSLVPIYWALASSLMQPTELTAQPINLVPPAPSFHNYRTLLGGLFSSGEGGTIWYDFTRALRNSMVTALGATILTVAVASIAAYAVVRLRFPGRQLVFMAIVATIAVPGYTVLIPLYRIMVAANLIDTYTGVILIYVSAFLPLAMWLMRSVYESLPLSLEEAAYVDGAGRLYTFFRIVLPLTAPGLVAAAILTFLGAWGQFSVPLIFSTTMATKPLTVLIPEFATKNNIDYGLINAAGVIAMVPPALIVVFLNRFLMRGLMAGAGK